MFEYDINEPLVTIVTVTYNAEKYLEKTIQSVLSQDYKNIEYIIIDGCSSDNTVSIIKQYEKNIHFWASEKDQGVYEAMNKGIRHARGKWINFLNAGDLFSSSDVVSRLMNSVEDNSDILCGDIYQIFENNSKKLYRSAPGLQTIMKPLSPCVHQAAFIKLDVMQKNYYSEKYKISADYEFFLKAYLQKCKFQFVNFAVCDFLIGGMSAENQVLGRAESVNIMIENIDNPKSYAKENVFVHAFDHLTGRGNVVDYKKMAVADAFRKLHIQLLDIIASNYQIVVYGNGSIGQLITKFLGPEYVTMIVDQYDTISKFNNVRVGHPSELDGCEFDYIFISVFGREEEIEEYLCSALKVEKSKIMRSRF